jgi:hypothetical protein
MTEAADNHLKKEANKLHPYKVQTGTALSWLPANKLGEVSG